MDVGLGHAWQVAKEFADMAVLILVLVDVGLGPLGIPVEKKNHSVLILVLVDVGLGLV